MALLILLEQPEKEWEDAIELQAQQDKIELNRGIPCEEIEEVRMKERAY